MYFFGYDYTQDAPEYDKPSIIYSIGWDNIEYAFDKNPTTRTTNDGVTISTYIFITWPHPTSYPPIRAVFFYDTNIPIDILSLRYRDTSGSYAPITLQHKYISEDGKHIMLLWQDLIPPPVPVSAEKTLSIDILPLVLDKTYYITEIQTFDILEQINTSEDVKADYNRAEFVYTNSDNKKVILFKNGAGLNINLNFKAHMADDVDLLDTLYARNDSFYIWLNGGEDDIIKQTISPWKFEDVIKVSILKKRKPSFHKNLIFSGFNDLIQLVKVE